MKHFALYKSRVAALLILVIAAMLIAVPAHADMFIVSNAAQILRYNENTGAFIGVFATSALTGAGFDDLAVGPDGNLYLLDWAGMVFRYNAITGDFMDIFIPEGSGGLVNANALEFGPDGKLYILSDYGYGNDCVRRYDAATGAYIDVFIASVPWLADIIFGPDGNAYLRKRWNHETLKYSPTTKEYLGTSGTSPWLSITQMTSGPDGNTYANVDYSDGHINGQIVRYNGTTMEYIGEFVPPQGRQHGPVAFGQDGNLYASGPSSVPGAVYRYNGSTGEAMGTLVSDGIGGLVNPGRMVFYTPPPRPTTVYVDPSYTSGSAGGHTYGYDAFSSIQPAIGMVAPGGAVHVAPGTYAEAVVIDKSMQVIGTGASTTAIHGNGSTCISIAAEDVTVEGFTLASGPPVIGGQCGINATTNNSRFRKLIVENSYYGIRLLNSDNNIVQGNAITTMEAYGILLSGSRQNAVHGNTLSDNDYNIVIENSSTRAPLGNVIQANVLLNPGHWSVAVYAEPLSMRINGNVFSTTGTNDKYVFNSSSTLPVNAEWNWWGGENPPQVGDFSGPVDYLPCFATNATVSVFPQEYFAKSGSTMEFVVSALIPAGTYVKGTSLRLNWTNDAAIPDVGDPIEGTFFDDGTGAKTFFFNATDNSVKVDQTFTNNTGNGGVGNPTGGLPYVGSLFGKVFHAGSTGSSTLTLSDIFMRAPDNSTITPDIVPTGGATLISDGTPPTISNVLIDNQTIDNDAYVKNGDRVVVSATVTDDYPLDVSQITGNLNSVNGGSGHTADNPATYTSSIATWSTVGSASCTPSDGLITVTVTATDLAGNTASSSDDITADNTVPTKITNLTAQALHGRIRLSWTNGADDHPRGMEIRYNKWNDYPKYDAAAPSYPADHTLGTLATNVASGASVDWVVVPRDVYYMSAFAYDYAGNYSAVDAEGQDRATNYFPADIGSGTGLYIPGLTGYDGQVNHDDLYWFSKLYFKTEGEWTYATDAEADFGPTVASKGYPAGHRFAIPRPDNVIDFEDLMIFSMNYNNVAPKISPPADRQLVPSLAIDLKSSRATISEGEILLVTVRLANDGRAVKGVSAELKYDPSLLRVLDVHPGGLMGGGAQGLVLHRLNNGTLRIDAAVLGAGRAVDFSGDVAVVRFLMLQSGDGSVALNSAIVRDENNNAQAASLDNAAEEVPTTFDLSQNYPNPFNPTTVIRYQLPVASMVRLVVHDILGRVVTVLVNERKEAGRYTAWFDGTDHASGVYYCRMTADGFESVRRMLFLK
jgi:parallel beta-helix repeat protein